MRIAISLYQPSRTIAWPETKKRLGVGPDSVNRNLYEGNRISVQILPVNSQTKPGIDLIQCDRIQANLVTVIPLFELPRLVRPSEVPIPLNCI